MMMQLTYCCAFSWSGLIILQHKIQLFQKNKKNIFYSIQTQHQMKRSLRSRNSCQPIQNFFDKEIGSEFSKFIELIPQQILNKLSKKKFVLCEDLLSVQLPNRPNLKELQKIKMASKLLKQKCESGLQKIRKIQERPTINNSSFFDCLLNQEEMPRKIIKCEPSSYEGVINNRNKIEYKIEYNYANEDGPYLIGESYINFHDAAQVNINQHQEFDEKDYK